MYYYSTKGAILQKARILLLEDDINLGETIQEYLEDHGYDVDFVHTSQEALEKAYEKHYDIYLFDVMVPGIDGFELLKKIRLQSDTPAIFITALESVKDLEKGFASGADDYIRKPFELKELLLRIQTLLKRRFDTAQKIIPINEKSHFDITTSELIVQGTPANLNQKELRLLKLFLQHPNQPLSHERIYETLWDYDETPSDMALRTYIKNLRKYLGKDRIQSIKRYGYKFVK